MDTKYDTAMDANALLCMARDLSVIPQINREDMEVIEEAHAILWGIVSQDARKELCND